MADDADGPTDRRATNPVDALMLMLTRMEGKFDLLAQRMDHLSPRVERHEVAIATLQLTTQRLDLDAVARDRTVVATAAALKDAKDASEAAGRAEQSKAEQQWSPAAKLVTALGAMAVLYSLLSAIIPGG